MFARIFAGINTRTAVYPGHTGGRRDVGGGLVVLKTLDFFRTLFDGAGLAREFIVLNHAVCVRVRHGGAVCTLIGAPRAAVNRSVKEVLLAGVVVDAFAGGTLEVGKFHRIRANPILFRKIFVDVGHDILPDFSGDGRAVDAGHGARRIVADPDRGGVIAGVAAEPCVLRVVCGTGLTGCLLSVNVQAAAGAVGLVHGAL